MLETDFEAPTWKYAIAYAAYDTQRISKVQIIRELILKKIKMVFENGLPL